MMKSILVPTINNPAMKSTFETALQLAKRRVATLLADVRERRFENVTDWLPRASVKLKKSQVFDRPKARRSSADFDPRYQSGALVVFESCCLLHNVLTR